MKKKSLRIPQNCLDEECGGGGYAPRGSVQLFPVEDPRFLLETRKFREGSLVHPPPCFTGVLSVAASAVAQEVGTPGGGGLRVSLLGQRLNIDG